MAKRSAGLLVHRRSATGTTEVLLAHPGGPLWTRKDAGAWSLPKGEYEADEEPLAAARREFLEELGLPAPTAEPQPLGEVRLPSGKVVIAWAVEGELDVDAVVPGLFAMEWPPRSGRQQEFPEVDRVAWFDLAAARVQLAPGQVPFLDRLAAVPAHAPGAAGQ